jgi:hypothetical protein
MHIGAHEGTGCDHSKAIALRRLDRPLGKRVGNASSAESGGDVGFDQHDRVRMTFIPQGGNLTGDFRLQSTLFRIVPDNELSRGPDANASDNRIGGGIARRECFLDSVVQFVFALHTSTSRRALALGHAMSNTCAKVVCTEMRQNRAVAAADRAKNRKSKLSIHHAQPQTPTSV